MELGLVSYLVEPRCLEVYISVLTLCCRGFLGLAPCVGASSAFGHSGFLPFREAPFPLLGYPGELQRDCAVERLQSLAENTAWSAAWICFSWWTAQQGSRWKG